MEKNNGTVSHFTGVIRIVAFVIIIAVVAFFGIRWIRGRQDTNRANQAISSQQNAQQDTEGQDGDDGEEAPSSSESTTNEGEDNNQDTAVTTEIPRVGAGSTFAGLASASVLAYAAVSYGISVRKLKDHTRPHSL